MHQITDHNRDRHKHHACEVAKSWSDPNRFRTAHEDILRVLCKEIGSDYSNRVLDCLRTRDYNRLISMDLPEPGTYMFSSLYRDDAQIRSLISKYPYWDIEANPKLEAMKKFIECEHQCSATNTKIQCKSLFKDSTVASVLSGAQKKIAAILGEVPSIKELTFKFGPGSAFSVKNNTSALDKLESSLDVTANCYGLAESFLLDCPGWKNNDGETPSLSLIPGDRLCFVPKNAKTDRPIGVNGLLNSLIQKGIGVCIRKKLKPVINLRFAQEKHRRLALQASRLGHLATIDLASASDTISYNLVLDLLPPAWFDLLDQARSPSYSIDGNLYDYHKFSAMGNGYTFELETLLFWAISDSCREYLKIDGSVSVYGDDIIAPSQCAQLIIAVLKECGFNTNDEKTFVAGPFRESCGGDYFNGYDVRPFYLKDRISFRTLFLLHNFWARKGLNFVYPKTFRFIRKLIGKDVILALRSSDSESDGVIYDPTVPLASHFFISSMKRGRKRKADDSPFSVSLALYKSLYKTDFRVINAYIGSRDSPEEEYFSRNSFLKSRVSLHRHI